jgi:hypothetical protein
VNIEPPHVGSYFFNGLLAHPDSHPRHHLKSALEIEFRNILFPQYRLQLRPDLLPEPGQTICRHVHRVVARHGQLSTDQLDPFQNSAARNFSANASIFSNAPYDQRWDQRLVRIRIEQYRPRRPVQCGKQQWFAQTDFDFDCEDNMGWSGAGKATTPDPL